ncbi:MAG: hypothetical protein RL223_1710 [Pseudomonadota bacterium]|jgi:flavin reductase
MSPTLDTAAPTAAVPVDTFRQGLALLAGAVNVITTDGPAGQAGFTATAVTSVSDSPPTVLVCMNRASWAHGHFQRNGVLCVNVLAAAQQDVSALYADRTVSMDARFARTPWQPLAGGAPGLDGALAQLAGRITASHEVGSHSIFIVTLDEVRHPGATADASALTWFNRRYHAVG